MQSPIESRGRTFRFSLVGSIVIVASALIEWLAEPLVSLVIFVSAAVATIGIAVAMYLSTVSQDRPLISRRTGKGRASGALSRTRRSLLVGKNAHRPGAA
jgi:multisubunit Na+/H+ antiporter MnhG subunit